MEIKTGDNVQLKKDTFSMNSYVTLARDKQLPLTVYSVSLDKKSIFCKTSNLAINDFNDNPFVISVNFVTPISKETTVKLTKDLNKDFEKIYKEKAKKLKTEHISPFLRKYEPTSSKMLIRTDLNFAFIGNIANNNKRWLKQCCDFSKTSAKITVYIPKSWLNYLGYNLIDLKMYIKFLRNCEIGFNAEVLEIVDLHSEFSSAYAPRRGRIYTDFNNTYIGEKEMAYKVEITPSTSGMVTYLYFILLRYMYNNLYFNIPYMAMQLKKNMPKVSNWDCMLLVHNLEQYNPGYALISTSSRNELIPCMSNSAESILKKLSKNSGMNSSFLLHVNPPVVPERPTIFENRIKKWILEENYTELQNLLDQFKNK